MDDSLQTIGLTVQVLQFDPIPDGSEVVAKVEHASRLYSREDSLPAPLPHTSQ